MNNIISKIFNLTKKLNQKELSFQKIKNSTKILKIFQSISSHNEWSEVRYVGGCVRKILNNENYDDIDLATNLDPQQIKECLSANNIKFFETGIKHGTITATIEKQNFEITSLRKDIATDGRHAEVLFTKDWNEDSGRRDFTINSIYADIDGNIFDPNDGANDLKNGIVRFIGNPEKRIKEDYLRILRYLRFFSTYSLKDHRPEIKKSIMQNISGVVGLSKERLLDEFKKIFKSGALFKLNKDHFSNDVISLVFPQFINLNLLTKLDKNNQKTLLVKSFDFLLAFLVIDETDNSDYFLYKFKTSNETKKKINFLKKSFLESAEKNYFSKKNLEKIFYFNEKSDVLDLIDFELFKSKKNKKKLIELKNYFIKTEKPVFPVKAKNIMEKFDLKEGRELGQKLKYLEDLWVNNSFNISEKEIEKTFQG
jgi:tRNA nucleotidyltransferase/poly(A) polymerase